MKEILKAIFRSKPKYYWIKYPKEADNEDQKVEFMAEIWEEMERKIKIKRQ
jgi:hypothetical protein